jgi:two-component system, NarL family, sensor histidine kinase DegS
MSQSADPSPVQAIGPGDLPGDMELLRAGMVEEIAALDRELEEIGLLARQAHSELERHEARRHKGEERVTALERDGQDAAELREARSQLLTLTRRALLFDAQQEVLEGKHKTLQRFRDRLDSLYRILGGVDAVSVSTRAVEPAPERRLPESATVMRAQEDLRREIARQMHDGPAQSLANIALQAEIVERLVGRGDARAKTELEALRKMVQSTLSATKEFIFDVRPMVLDDLGLVPTLRRTAVDRGRRAKVEVDFDSSGTDRRLSADLESGLFRILDDAIAGYVVLHPARVTVRLDWAEQELFATVRAHWPSRGEGAGTSTRREPEITADMPPALAAMIEQNATDDRRARVAARSLPEARVEDLRERATTLGVALALGDNGQTIELTARTG